MSSKVILSAEEGLSATVPTTFGYPTPLLKPKIKTTDVYLSKIRMLTPSAKNQTLPKPN